MFHRRPRYDFPASLLPSSAAIQNNSNDIHRCTVNYHELKHGRKALRQKALWILSLVGLFLIYIFLRYTSLADAISVTVEGAFQDPYRRAKIFNPFRTFQARYLDTHRPQGLKTFHLTNETAFVVNLDRDKDRLRDFRHRNPSFIQRFGAHQWTKNNTSENPGVQIQQQWGAKYPWIKIASDRGNPGDAACSLSHILLWKEKLLGVDGQDYIFIFEDDIRMTEPLRSQHILQAPDVADIVFLMPSAMKRVLVPWKEMNPDNSWNISKRVIGGFGTFGYLITRQGAIKMMDFLATCREPIDLAFFGSSSVQVYLPESWPLVRHSPNPNAESSRLQINQNAK
jgi:GR25 family glycosyltransferase involved in LPS biosynthesis